MSMLEVLKSLEDEHFDAKKGKVSDGIEELPEGTYNCVLKSVTHRAKNGRGFLMFGLEVVDGDYAGRTESIFPTLEQVTSKGNPMPDFVLARSIKTIKVIGAMVGLDVPNACFLDDDADVNYDAIEKAFDGFEGKMLQMTIKIKPNKKNPDQPYRNYEFAEIEQPKVAEVQEDPFAQAAGAEVDEADLPF